METSIVERLRSADTAPELRRAFAHIKRFRERWLADAEFRAQLPKQPEESLRQHGIELDVAPYRNFFLDNPYGELAWEEMTPLAREAETLYQQWSAEYYDHVYDLEALESTQNAYRKWRERQLQRCMFHMGPGRAYMSLHLPFAVELSQGCSVGCWFCGLSAESLEGHWRAGKRNLVQWREVMEATRELFGGYGRRGFLYYATDPLDNPDYETFGREFAAVHGRWPPLTSAVPLRNIERTRRVLEESRRALSFRQRFSILTLRAMNDMHREFDAEELLDVVLVPLNKESFLGLAIAGRVLNKIGRMDERIRDEQEKVRYAAHRRGLDDNSILVHNTISCVSGFLIQMVPKIVQLQTPANATPELPNGHLVLEEAQFRDAAHLRELMQGMVERHMPLFPPADVPLLLQPEIALEDQEDGALRFFSQGHEQKIHSRAGAASLRALVQYFRQEAAPQGCTPREACQQMCASNPAIVRHKLLTTLGTLWELGILVPADHVPTEYQPVKIVA